jgi:hypothetical protein
MLVCGLVRKLVDVFWAAEGNTHFQDDVLDDVLLLFIEGFNNVPLYEFLALLSVRTLHAQV